MLHALFFKSHIEYLHVDVDSSSAENDASLDSSQVGDSYSGECGLWLKWSNGNLIEYFFLIAHFSTYLIVVAIIPIIVQRH